MLYLHLIARQLSIIGKHLVTVIKIVISFIRSHPRSSAVGGAVILIALIALVYFFGGSPVEDVIPAERSVTITKVVDVSGLEPLSLIGTVRATREALVAPDFSGTVSGVYRGLGDFVAAGTIIAELKNDSQRAQVAQARAALDKTKSTIAVGGINIESAELTLKSAEESARTSVSSAYATIDDVVRRKADQTFSNPTSPVPQFNLSSSNSQSVTLAENGRVAMQPILARHAAASPENLTADALSAELERLQKEVVTLQSFMQNVVAALNGAIPANGVTEATIAAYRADVSTASATVNALAASLTATIENLRARKAAVEVAKTSLATGTSGVSADVAAAEANLAAAIANLEKTLIRAPISGTINRLDLDVGSFVGASQPVIYITSAGGLEAVAFVSSSDIRDIAVGAKVMIGGNVQGSVVRVAGAVDPITKKAEVRISVPASAPLVAGQSATLAIERAQRTTERGTISIPLSAVKITPDGTVVFSLGEGNTLVARPVELGTLRGAFVEIVSGITLDDSIVTDARGLKEGQVVIVK